MKSDPIERQAAIEHLKKRLYETELNSTAEYPYYQEIADNRVDIWINEVPSAEPEQTGCEYCHEDSNGYVRPVEKNSHAWLVRRGRSMKLRVCFKGGYSECDILFCPMCGRRLTDG